MVGLDAPVVAVKRDQVTGAGAGRGVVGDAIDDLGGGLAGFLLTRSGTDEGPIGRTAWSIEVRLPLRSFNSQLPR